LPVCAVFSLPAFLPVNLLALEASATGLTVFPERTRVRKSSLARNCAFCTGIGVRNLPHIA
jgi:hypothetical protein